MCDFLKIIEKKYTDVWSGEFIGTIKNCGKCIDCKKRIKKGNFKEIENLIIEGDL